MCMEKLRLISTYTMIDCLQKLCNQMEIFTFSRLYFAASLYHKAYRKVTVFMLRPPQVELYLWGAIF